MKYLFFLLTVLVVFNQAGLEKKSTSCDFDLPKMTLECTLKIPEASKEDGFTVLNFPSSSVKKSEGHFDDGVPSAYWKFFYKNGKVHWEGNYSNGQLNGFFSLYYESGRVRERGRYANCQREGYWDFHFDNKKSQVQYKGHFENGVPVGVWQEFNKTGKLVSNFECK